MQAQCEDDCAVISDVRPKLMKTLAAVDGSPASLRALKFAIDQMKPMLEGSLVLLNVQNYGTLGLAGDAGIMSSAWIEQEEREAARQALQDAAIACRAAGVDYVTRSEQGPVAATIYRVAHEENVAHIIMRTRGLGGIRGLILGSVATQLLNVVDVPVTLVK